MHAGSKRAASGTLDHEALAPEAVVPAPRPGLAARLTPSHRTVLIWAVAFLLLISFPLVDSNGGDLDSFANAGVYVLLALGLNVVLGFSGLLDIGYAAFFALRAYTYRLAPSFQLKPPS